MAGLKTIPRRELILLGVALALGLALRVLYVRLTLGHTLAGDEIEHDRIARLFADGHFMSSTIPYGDLHPTMVKGPVYPTFVGVLYAMVGEYYDRVLTLQTLVGPVVIFLTWLLGRRLFSPAIAIAAAFVVAVYPFAWQFETRLYSEVISTPLVLIALLLFLDKEPTRRRAVLLGLTLGLLALTRPALGYLIVGVAAGWWAAFGARRALLHTAMVAGVAALVIAPWTLRNYLEYDSFVPISYQDAVGISGVFNSTSAGDPEWPYQWRATNPRDAPLLARENAMEEDELRSKLIDNGIDYIKDHPASVPKAFFWNGLSRFWDIRRPRHVLDEVDFEGRSHFLTKVGLAMYYVLLPLALLGLWSVRRRPGVFAAVVAIAAGASVVHTFASLTRYRSILEPLIVILACAGGAVLVERARLRRELRTPAV